MELVYKRNQFCGDYYYSNNVKILAWMREIYMYMYFFLDFFLLRPQLHILSILHFYVI